MKYRLLTLVPVLLLDAAALGCLLAAVAVALKSLAKRASPGGGRTDDPPDRGPRFGRAAFYLSCAGLALVVIVIGLVLPSLLPVALCGSDVMQASGSAGPVMMAYRLLALAVLYVWHQRERLDAGGVLSDIDERLLMAALPLVFLTLKGTVSFARALENPCSVECCGVVYDAAGHVKPLFLWDAGAGFAGLATFHVFSVGLWGWGLHLLRRASVGRNGLPWYFGASLVWCVAAYLVAVYGYESDFLMDPALDCPWCLLRPESLGVGFVLFPCIAVAALEGFTAYHAAGVARWAPEPTAAAALGRSGSAVRHLLAAVALFYLVYMGIELTFRLG